MEGEIRNFMIVWFSAFASLSYCNIIYKIIPRKALSIRLFTIIPTICLSISTPLSTRSSKKDRSGCKDCVANQMRYGCPSCVPLLHRMARTKCIQKCDCNGGKPKLSDCKKCMSRCKCSCVA
ncbi:hypothetical protein ACOSP7_015803 [Xanthoceras sorbifolium]